MDYDFRDNTLYLITHLKTKLIDSTSQFPMFIVIPKLRYDVYLHKCGSGTISCNQVSQDSIYHGELNWLTVYCASSSCDQQAKLPIILDKELIDRLVDIVKDNEKPAFQIVLDIEPYAIVIPYIMAPASQPDANVVRTLNLIIMNASVKGNLSNDSRLIVFSSDNVRDFLNKIKYAERVKIEVEVKLPETTEGLPGPLIDAIKELEAAFNDINNLDFASAIIKCRGAIEHVTTKPTKREEEKGGEHGRVIKDEVKGAILDRYEDGSAAKEFYTKFLKSLDRTSRNIHEMASMFLHPDSNKAKFNPRMADAIYICRQTLGIIDYLVELSRA
ncbi:MAG: hypothetical protein RXO24_07505 [Acidilobus sp.]